MIQFGSRFDDYVSRSTNATAHSTAEQPSSRSSRIRFRYLQPRYKALRQTWAGPTFAPACVSTSQPGAEHSSSRGILFVGLLGLVVSLAALARQRSGCSSIDTPSDHSQRTILQTLVLLVVLLGVAAPRPRHQVVVPRRPSHAVCSTTPPRSPRPGTLPGPARPTPARWPARTRPTAAAPGRNDLRATRPTTRSRSPWPGHRRVHQALHIAGVTISSKTTAGAA